MSEASEITVTIKSSVDKKYELTIPVTITVAELKDKVAAESDVPAERQRLIYSGRVLKDQDTVETYKIKTGHTIHLVKSAGAKQSTPASTTNNASSASTTSATAGSGATNQSIPSNIASGQGSFNPLAGLTGARYAGLAQLPSESLFGPDGGMGALPNEDDMERMMENPMFQSSMNELLRNPQMLDYMIESNPQLRGMGPQVRQMMQSEQFRQMLTNPQMMRQMREMQRMFGGGPQQQTQSFPAPGSNPTTESTSDTTRDANTTPGSDSQASGAGAAGANPFAALFPGGAPPANPFSMFGNPGAAGGNAPAFDPALLQSILGGGAGGFGGNAFGAPAQPEDNRPPEERYESQLRQLNDMGFSDFESNVRALRRSGGSVQGAVENLLSGL